MSFFAAGCINPGKKHGCDKSLEAALQLDEGRLLLGTVNFAEQEKKRLREEFLLRRQSLSTSLRLAADRRIVDALFAYISEHTSEGQGTAVTLYRSVRGEVDVWPCAELLWQAGFSVAVPIVDQPTGSMFFAQVSEDTVWNVGSFGIPEPKGETVRALDAKTIKWMVVPGLAFTRTGVRLGYGGGYYDRFFSAFRERYKPVAIGAAFSCQLASELPSLPHDIRMDVLVTEDEVMKCTP